MYIGNFLIKAIVTFNKKVLLLCYSGNTKIRGELLKKFDLPGYKPFIFGVKSIDSTFAIGLSNKIVKDIGVNITLSKPFFISAIEPKHFGMTTTESYEILLIVFECKAKSDKLRLSEEYAEYKWIDPKEYKTEGLYEYLWPVFTKYNDLKN